MSLAMDNTVRYGHPQRVPDLKSARLWGLEWCDQTFGPDVDFTYFIVERARSGDDGYLIHGHADTTQAAFRLRKQLAEETGGKLFIRARRVEQRQVDVFGDDDGALDFFSDKFNEGVGVADIPRHLRADYQRFCRNRGRSAR